MAMTLFSSKCIGYLGAPIGYRFRALHLIVRPLSNTFVPGVARTGALSCRSLLSSSGFRAERSIRRSKRPTTISSLVVGQTQVPSSKAQHSTSKVKRVTIHMKVYSIIVALVFCSGVSTSQELDSTFNEGDYIGIETGYGYFRIRDITESPLMYGNSFLPLQLFYSHRNDKEIHEIRLSYLHNVLESSITNGTYLSTNNECAGLEYTYVRNTDLPLMNSFLFYAGGSFVNYISYRDHDYGGEMQPNADIFSCLSLKSRIIKELDQQSNIIWDCSLPLCAYVMFRRYDLKGLPDGATNTSFTFGDMLRTGNLLTVNKFVDFQKQDSI